MTPAAPLQSDTTFGSNANGRICGALLSEATAIDAGSHDPDTAEGDTLAPVELTSDFYSPTQYKLVRERHSSVVLET